jgi:hypothetical protein
MTQPANRFSREGESDCQDKKVFDLDAREINAGHLVGISYWRGTPTARYSLGLTPIERLKRLSK